MKGVLKYSLGLSLGLLAGGAWADDLPWRPAGAPRPIAAAQETHVSVCQPAATLARPVARSASAEPSPAVALQRPIALGTPAPITDTHLQPTSFSLSVSGATGLLARGLNSDAPRPLPPGPPPTGDETLKMPTPITPKPVPVTDPGATVMPFGAGVAPGICGPIDCSSPCCIEADSTCCCGGGCLGSGNIVYFDAEYLLWWFKGAPTPPLVSRLQSPQAVVPGIPPGSLFDPNASVIFGGASVDTQAHSGGRFTVGAWFDDEQTCGLEGSIMFLSQRSAHFQAGSSGDVGIYRPYFNADLGGLPDAEEVSGIAPRPLGGLVRVDLASRLWGAEVNFRQDLLCCPNWRLDLIEGFRFIDLDESLKVTENLIAPTTPDLAGGSFLISDRFRTENRFYGGQIGLLNQFRCGPWTLDLRSKVALGWTHQVADISGSTLISSPGAAGGVMVFPGGLLTQRSNINRFSRERFSVVPELGMNVGYQICDSCRLFVGYNFLYMSSVARPGNQIDTMVSPSQLPGATPSLISSAGGSPGRPNPTRPMFAFNGTDFWVHGVNVGLEFRY